MKMPTILVISGQRAIRARIQDYLEAEGHRVIASGTGREGVAMCRENPLDLVITDIFMPGMDGIEVIRALGREKPASRLLAISAGGVKLDAGFALKLAAKFGAHETLGQPFTRQRLALAVSNALKRDGGPGPAPVG